MIGNFTVQSFTADSLIVGRVTIDNLKSTTEALSTGRRPCREGSAFSRTTVAPVPTVARTHPGPVRPGSARRELHREGHVTHRVPGPAASQSAKYTSRHGPA